MVPRKLGIVSYLNMLPLLEGLETTFPEECWTRATPRRLAEMLVAGDVDAAAVSVYEGLLHAERYLLVPGVCIGSDGAVRSVALFSRVPFAEIRSVLLDAASLTSIHLAQVLLRELLGVDPACELSPAPIAPDHDWRGGPHDAIVAIGDTALRWEHEFPHRLDLGEGWKQLTGLPFVFAAWWAREAAAFTPAEIAAFATARDRGLQSVDAIVARVLAEDPTWPGGAESLRQYFSRAIVYTMGEAEMKALLLFREKLLKHGFLPADAAEVRVAESAKRSK